MFVLVQSVAEMTSHDVLLRKLSLAWCALSCLPHELQGIIKTRRETEPGLVDYVLSKRNI